MLLWEALVIVITSLSSISGNQVLVYDNMRYVYSAGSANWQDAENACVALGGHLASIHTLAESEFLDQISGSENWVGGYRETVSSPWQWTDEASFSYTDWYSDTQTTGLCLQSGNIDNLSWWFDADCNAVKRYICKLGMEVHGEWGKWSNWTECDKPCGVGFQNRSRVCDDPAPANGGNDCVGEDHGRQMCNTNYCPEMCDVHFKMCGCEDVPVIYDTSVLQTNATFNGMNESAVNASLQTIALWNNDRVKVLCRNAQCSEADLQTAIDQIKAETDDLQTSLHSVGSSLKLLRKMIDCKANVWLRKDELFDHYQILWKRKVIVQRVHEDLTMKKTVLVKEIQRCMERSWLRKTLEGGWSKYL